MHPSERPSVTGGIHGDGNCFFRSMPFLVTGVQQHHSQLQNACTTYMDAHKGCFEALAQCQNYIDQSKMKYNGTYATKVEIFAMARNARCQQIGPGREPKKTDNMRPNRLQIRPPGSFQAMELYSVPL